MALTGGERSRRELLRDAAVLGAGAAVAGAVPAGAARRRASKPTALVLGGGMAGLTAAHELIERGFDVTVVERKALGGKARSIGVPGSATGGRRPLPGEHGFRFFPGFYHHVPDTMRRIPVRGQAGGVRDNLVDAPMAVMSLKGQPDLELPFGFTAETPGALTPGGLLESVLGALGVAGKVPPHELAEFVTRLGVFLTSSDERRFGQWERTSWFDFVRAEGKSETYRTLLAAGLTRALVAAKEDKASARTIGNMAEAFVANFSGRGNDGSPDRVLNAPTNEAWIDPWVLHLRGLGVRFRVGWTVEGLRVARGRIAGVRVRDRRGRRRVLEAQHVVLAVPAERAVRLVSKQVLALDPSLEGLRELQVDWMNGIQLFLRREAPLTAGHMAYMGTPWSLTSINQAQFWEGRSLPRDYGDGTVRDVLSVDVSDWDTPGVLFGKPAKRCSPQEVQAEVWAQIKASVNDVRRGRLRDEDLHSWFLDPGIRWSARLGRNHNDDPLLVNTVGSWESRPEARTAIPNLVLAGDHVRTNIDLATMEGANESARVAVNAILDATGSKAERVRTFTLYRPPEFEEARRQDAARWRAGQRHIFDV